MSPVRKGNDKGMGYVLAGLLVALLVVGAVTFLVLTSRRQGREHGRAAADRDHATSGAMMAEEPDSPLGDTGEHAGEQRDGETVAGQDAELSGGSGRRHVLHRATDSPAVARPLIGGEGEGHRRIA